MKTAKYLSTFFIAILIHGQETYAQGCSDAGFCTMGAMKPDQAYNEKLPVKLRSIDVTFYEGQSNVSANIKSGILDFGLITRNDIALQFKVPYMWVNGNFGSTSGLGDLSLSATKKIVDHQKYDILATIGAKIPSGRSNLRHKEHDVVLPMYYQVSLGTYDFIMGASFINKDWLFSVGYQQPIIHQNENSFRGSVQNWAWYEGGMDYVWKHDEALDLKRGADVMMRVERNFRLSRLNFNLGLLPIYRVTKDQGKDENGEYQKLEGTTGLALSALGGVGYRFNVFSSIKLIYGMQLADREYNPDGLTRKHVLNVTYHYNF
ncbi:hypothetical protein JKA74_03945 [Marivirga sp. S37H4]|uniref:Uncharacterized protein n=1 Tax=Marivirga aurantiaca TaxID=2802615 RepID=A0A935C9C3_9BACT|nr:hypothetical protein [Marivirga aurantiaca]MBK6264178.1 hypothetical protein [Marivirga aurantiaca]